MEGVLETVATDNSVETLADCLARLRRIRQQVEDRRAAGSATADDAALLCTLDGVERLLAELSDAVPRRH